MAVDDLSPVALLVDPDADTRELYAFALGRDCWTVAAASDGAEGFARAVELRPDVVVTELMMPELDGFELCRRLKRDPATSEIPVVVVTASAFAADVAKATEAGSEVVVSKPYLPADLVALLGDVVRRSRALRAASDDVRRRARKVLVKSSELIAKSQRLNAPKAD